MRRSPAAGRLTEPVILLRQERGYDGLTSEEKAQVDESLLTDFSPRRDSAAPSGSAEEEDGDDDFFATCDDDSSEF